MRELSPNKYEGVYSRTLDKYITRIYDSQDMCIAVWIMDE